MLISQPLPFVTAFIEAINIAIQDHQPGSPGLSRTQRWWLGICLMGIMVTNSVCWARFERASLGRYSLAALAWMFRHTKVPWEWLLQMRVQVLASYCTSLQAMLGMMEPGQRGWPEVSIPPLG